MPSHDVVCFHCGQSVGDPPVLNLIEDEEPCPACAERLLEALPGIFHSPFETVGEIEPVDQVDSDADLEGA